MLHFVHCQGAGIISAQQTDVKVNEVAPREVHAQWVVSDCLLLSWSPIFLLLSSLHRQEGTWRSETLRPEA